MVIRRQHMRRSLGLARDRHTDRQTKTQTDRQTDRHMHLEISDASQFSPLGLRYADCLFRLLGAPARPAATLAWCAGGSWHMVFDGCLTEGGNLWRAAPVRKVGLLYCRRVRGACVDKAFRVMAAGTSLHFERGNRKPLDGRCLCALCGRGTACRACARRLGYMYACPPP